MNKKVSVIVNNYNKAPYIRECLQSIINQTYDNWEIIFWDDNSTDNSLIIVRDLRLELRDIDKLKIFETRLETPFNQSLSLPLGVVRWLAVQKVKGDYIAFLDADDIWKKDKLEKQMKIFKNNPEVKLVFSDAQYFYTEARSHDEKSGAIFTDKKVFLKETFHNKYFPLMYNPFLSLLTNYNFMPCLTLIFEREAFMKVIGSPTHYTSGEDYDWLLKMTAKYKCDYFPEPLAEYRIAVPGSVNNQPITSIRATWNEIDCRKRNKDLVKMDWLDKAWFYRGLFKLYMKLIWKQFKEIKSWQKIK